MILYCPKCGHIWEYTGKAETDTSCAKCKSYINLDTQRLDRDIPVTADHYSGAKYLGVTGEEIIYWDASYGGVIYDLETGRWIEDEEKHDTPLDFFLAVEERPGFKYHIPVHEIIEYNRM